MITEAEEGIENDNINYTDKTAQKNINITDTYKPML